ncbi:MAG: ABC transporter substrate-binding protein [Eggerthellaceae bacterium]|nr:ABC transporter substrate-binding protein [Eggerthellaceae bacterium]
MVERGKKGWLKRIAAVGAACVLAASLGALAGCSGGSGSGGEGDSGSASAAAEQDGVRTFTDSCGREVELPATIDKIAPSGHTAQQVLLTIAPEKMVGLSQALNDDQLKIFGESFKDYPVFGAVLGATDNLNREAIAEAGPQVIIDTGEYKDGIEEDLDALQEQVGIPCVFVECKLSDYGEGYTTLGELLGEEERGQRIGDYLQSAYDEVTGVMDTIPEDQRVRMAYVVGDTGLNAIANGSFQGTVVDMVADNVVVVDKASGKGDGNEISLEQMAIWNPDLVVFQKQSVYDSVGSDAAWQTIAGVANDNYYLCPSNPWCWLNNPPTVNQMMGLQWLPRLLYPDKFSDSIQDVTKSYYKTLYDYDLSDAELNDLIKDSIPR